MVPHLDGTVAIGSTSERYFKSPNQTDGQLDDLIAKAADEFGIQRREISDDEIVDRLISALVGEGRKILDEGIAQRSSDIDIVYIYGYGFPASRGGPMFYAEQQQKE